MKIYLLLGINYLLENNKDSLKMHSNEEHEVNVNTQSHHFTFTEDEEKDVSSALVDKKVLHMMVNFLYLYLIWVHYYLIWFHSK
jgi:hypothetical protein